MKRLGVNNVELHAGDAVLLKDQYPKAIFDKILLDAPCSGLGVMKRKPEIKYHDSSVMDTIIPLQAKLLDNAYYLLKKGGKMVYSTCTINKKENELMIKHIKTDSIKLPSNNSNKYLIVPSLDTCFSLIFKTSKVNSSFSVHFVLVVY